MEPKQNRQTDATECITVSHLQTARRHKWMAKGNLFGEAKGQKKGAVNKVVKFRDIGQKQSELSLTYVYGPVRLLQHTSNSNPEHIHQWDFR